MPELPIHTKYGFTSTGTMMAYWMELMKGTFFGPISSNTHTIIGSIAVPPTATLGNTLMRVVCKETTITGPCHVGSYGETEDYLVNVIIPVDPTLSVLPTSHDFGLVPSGTTSTEWPYALSGLNLTPADGNITITPPANFAVSLTSGGPYTAYPNTLIKGYTGGSLSTTIYVVFQPTSPSTVYSGNIGHSGGGAPSVDVAVTGTSPCEAVADLNENFDAVTPPALPICWDKYISPSFSFQTVTTVTTAPFSSPNCVQLYSSGATAAIDAPLLITPQLNNINSTKMQLRFAGKGASTNLSIIVGTMTDKADPATFVPFATVVVNASTWTEFTVNFSTYAGTDQYIAFKHPLTTTYSYVYVDNAVWGINFLHVQIQLGLPFRILPIIRQPLTGHPEDLEQHGI
ncbi:MAG: choice-of-anchor J domain-containing protein [Bacteroidales bacterium]|nr:choice-of-anchor J domain-containing protein [Bacteroidales bacterium]